MHVWLHALALMYELATLHCAANPKSSDWDLAQVCEATMMLLEDTEASGKLLLVHVNGKFYMWKPPGFRKSLVPVQAPGPGSGAARLPGIVRRSVPGMHAPPPHS